MKLILAGLVALFTSTSFASHIMDIDPVTAGIAIDLIRAQQLEYESKPIQNPQDYRVIKIGLGSTAAGGVSILLGKFLLSSSEVTFGQVVAGSVLTRLGMVATIAGAVIVAAEAGYLIVKPTPAGATSLEDYYLSNETALNEFFQLPVDGQKSILQVSPKLRAFVVALAETMRQQQ